MFILEFSHPVSCRCSMAGQLGGTTPRRQNRYELTRYERVPRGLRTQPERTGPLDTAWREPRSTLLLSITSAEGKKCRMLAVGRTLLIPRITCRCRISLLVRYMHDFVYDFTGLHVRVFHIWYIFYVVRWWAKPTQEILLKLPTVCQ